MRSYANVAALLALAMAVVFGVTGAAAVAANDQAPAANAARAAPPTPAQVRSALEQVRKDPNLGAEHTENSLHWVSSDDPPREPGNSLQWLRDLFHWITASGRWLWWLVLAAAGIALLIYLGRIFRDGLPQSAAEVPTRPEQVQHLDIRPESLPADIGTAARALWDNGQVEAAMALLYRGLLSRLVHQHGVAIRESSTEGDCLRLARGRLSGEPMGYVQQLISTWQTLRYGARAPDEAAAQALFSSFATALQARP